MSNQASKKYTRQARTGIKGEAFFESLVADYAIPHHVVGPKDLGIDYLCEWVFGEQPTGVLFVAQVKTFLATRANAPKPIGVETKWNGLEKYAIRNSKLIVEEKTLCYWKGFGLPVYLFAIALSKETGQGLDRADCYYKRFTTVLTLDRKQADDPFYKVNDGNRFIAFAHDQEKRQGFARDLYIDLMRWAYYNGSIAYLNPRRLGLLQFGEQERVFHDLFRDYSTKVSATFAKTRRFLEENCPQVT